MIRLLTCMVLVIFLSHTKASARQQVPFGFFRAPMVASDVTPDPVDWPDFSNSANESSVETISGISANINLRISTSCQFFGVNGSYRINGGSYIDIASSASVDVTIHDGDTLQFGIDGTDTAWCDFTLTNLSASSVVIDTLRGTVDSSAPI
jgi:hypothetical protein